MEEEVDTFVPVTGITVASKTGTVGEPLTLKGTVAPTTATNKTISWSVTDADTTGIAKGPVKGNKVTATAAGTLKITATIKNGKTATTDYTQNFTIQLTDAFVPVTDITVDTTTGTVDTPFPLAGTVKPTTATNKTISWSVNLADSTATGTVSGNTVTATAPGTLKVTATIKNGLTATSPYTKDFDIVFPFVPVSGITVVTTTGTVGSELTLAGTVEPTTATNKTPIDWSIKNAGTTGITAIKTGNKVTATAPGTLVVTATIANGLTATSPYTADYNIVFPFVPVTDITDVPSTGTVDTELTLAGTIEPPDASYKTIAWSVKDPGTTGATLTEDPLTGRYTVTATTPGTLKVTATITNGTAQGTPYPKDFEIEIFPFVQVSGLVVNPLSGTVGTPFTLNWTIIPDNATNKDICWSVILEESTATGTIVGNTVYATKRGTLRVMATIANGLPQGVAFTKEESITFNDAFVAVTGITGIPETGTINTALTLAGTVKPSTATQKNIVWSIKDVGNTGATLIGSTVTATTQGTLMLTATIVNGTAPDTDYTQDFTIVISDE
jgi:endo-1,4-beta-xylanase